MLVARQGDIYAAWDADGEPLDPDVVIGVLGGAACDLDTNARIDLHVATPEVTASDDQGVHVNPLQSDVASDD